MKQKVSDCKYDDACNCRIDKVKCCEQCIWYWSLDSGYGYCRALPSHFIIPWCKDICSFFGRRT